jgi:hypothetical protein
LRRQLGKTNAADKGIQAPDIEAVPSERSRAHLQASCLVEPARQVLSDTDAWRTYHDTVFAIPPQLPQLDLYLGFGSSVQRLALPVLEAQLSRPATVWPVIDSAFAASSIAHP